MERGAWTDERLDDLAESIRTGFGRTDQDLRDLRTEMRAEFAAVHTEMRAEFASVREEIRGQIGSVRSETGSLRAEMDATRQTMLRIGAGMLGGMMFGFLSVIAAILARGA
jgi:hypothetical protein